MFGNRLIKFPGLDSKQVAIYAPDRVLYIEESDVGTVRTSNIHFDNGRWISVIGSVDEVGAALTDKKEQDEESEMEGWRKSARHRRIANKEVDAVMAAINYDGRPKEWSIQTAADGSRTLTAYLPPAAEVAAAYSEAEKRVKEDA